MDDECDVWGQSSHTYEQRWNMMKRELDANRPFAYRIPGHAIVGDGYRVEWIGGSPVDQVHIVYGWNGSNDGWWALTEVPGGDWSEDYFVREVYPDCSIGTTLETYYSVPSGPAYRYFNRDVSGPATEFEAGQWLQVLKSGFLLTNSGSGTGDEIVLQGHPYYETLIFINGDPVGDSRIEVLDGEMKVYGGGQIAVY
jgi:hypothetical protein